MDATVRDAVWFRRRLLDWFDRSRRDLPWRRTRDAYAIWVSEIMLQQTQVARVAGYYERFLAAMPTVHDLARADLDRVLELWEGLGYYGRARAMHRAARELVANHDGVLPRTVDRLVRLPGFGPYTAAAVASIAFGEQVAALDTNGLRVLARLGAIDSDPARADVRRAIDALAARILAPSRPGDFNQALMDLGAAVCTPRAPVCDRCPLAARCAARNAGNPERWPSKSRPSQRPLVNAACGLVARRGRWLMVRRPAHGLLGGLWEFPGGRIADGETPESACARGIREKTAIVVGTCREVDAVRHSFSHFRVVLHVCRCTRSTGRALASRTRWVAPDEFATLAMTRTARRIASSITATA